MKTNWDLTLLYKDENDPQIEKDLKSLERRVARFEKRYKTIDWETATQDEILKALESYGDVLEKGPIYKAYRYFGLRSSMDAKDEVANKRSGEALARIQSTFSRLTFFFLGLGKVSTKKQKELLGSKKLKAYHQLFREQFAEAKYRLSEEAERTAVELRQSAFQQWVDMQDEVTYKKTVLFEGREYGVTEAMAMVQTIPQRTRRHKLYRAVMEILKEAGNSVSYSVNGYLSYRKSMDALRGNKAPYSSSLRGDDMKEGVVMKMIDEVASAFSVSQSFYRLHAQLLKQDKLSAADLNVPISKKEPKYALEEAYEIVSGVFETLGDEYKETLHRYLERGQIDVYPAKAKRSGAFCWSSGTAQEPTYIMLNHRDDPWSVETLAHEMGHAIHHEKSDAKQPWMYRQTGTAISEVPSTFFEQAVLHQMIDRAEGEEKLVLMHANVKGQMSAIFAQAAVFRYEEELHARFRASGRLSNREIAALYAQHRETYLGPVADISELDGYRYVTHSTTHTYRFFYIYSYIYGNMVSREMYERWKANPQYIKQIEQFLESGSSQSPYQTFKSIGIDTNDPEFYRTGVERVKKDVAALRRLAKKLGKI